jgi:hypothetical protein
MLAEEHRKAKEGGAGKYNYVSARALERIGITEYKAVPGDHFLRIITPRFSKYPPNNLPAYWKEVWVHYNVGSDQKLFICMKKMKNQPCPVCDLAEKMKAVDPENEAIKELWPNRRYLFFVFDVRDNETEAKGLHWYDAPVTFKEEIVALSRDKRTHAYIDLSTLEEGKDIEFERRGKGVNTKYVGFGLRENAPPPKVWYDNAPDDFEEFIIYPSYEMVAAELPQLTGPVETLQVKSGDENVVRDPAPTRGSNPPVAAPVASPPVQENVPAPVAPPVQDPVEGRVQTRGTPAVETRGGNAVPTRGGTGVSPEVQARIDALRGRTNV